MSNFKERIEVLQKEIYSVLNKQDNWNVKTIKFLSNGVVNAVFILEEEDRGMLIARTPWRLDESEGSLFPQEDVASLIKESTIAKHCYKHGLKVPRVIHLHLSEEISFLVSEYIPGDDSVISADDIGRLVSAIHNIPLEGLSIIDQNNRTLSNIVSERIGEKADSLNKIQSRNIAVPSIKEMETTLNMSNTPHSLLHLDIRTPNIIGYKGEIKAVIDWDNAFIGDPLMEIMRISETQEINLSEFQKGYRNDELILSASQPIKLIYRLDTALMLAILFTSFIKDIEKGEYYLNRVDYLSKRLKKSL